MMHTILRRSAHADQLDEADRCSGCRAKLDEVRAARRDAVLHAVATVRPRRAVL